MNIWFAAEHREEQDRDTLMGARHSPSTYASGIRRRGRPPSGAKGRVSLKLLLFHAIEYQDISVRFSLGVRSFDDMRHSLSVLRHGPPRSHGDAAVNFVCNLNGICIDHRERSRVAALVASGLEGLQRCLVVLAVIFAVILRNGLSEGWISLSVNTPNIRDDKSIMAQRVLPCLPLGRRAGLERRFFEVQSPLADDRILYRRCLSRKTPPSDRKQDARNNQFVRHIDLPQLVFTAFLAVAFRIVMIVHIIWKGKPQT